VKLKFSRLICEKYSGIELHENPFSGSRVVRCGRTGMMKLIVVSAVLRTCLKILRSAHTVYLCVLCGSQNKQPLFPYTTLSDWFL